MLVALKVHANKLKELMETPQPRNWDIAGSIEYHEDCIKFLLQLQREEEVKKSDSRYFKSNG